MKTFLKVFNFIIVTFLVVSCQKRDKDESRPYEFGFTIDGEQHRHEKKDVNGIIEGEFGFITADGIYHVTVYATDENGNFRILSMRNVRISAPLDGSPLPPGAKIEGSQGNSPNKIQPQAPVNNPVQSLQTTTRSSRIPFDFTTQPTIKPACGGCGYVTTPKPVPGQKFPFQTPAFQNPASQVGGVSQNNQFPNNGINPGTISSSSPPNGGNDNKYQPIGGAVATNYPTNNDNHKPGEGTVETNYPSNGGNNNYQPVGGNIGTNYPSNAGNNNYQPIGGTVDTNYPTNGGNNNNYQPNGAAITTNYPTNVNGISPGSSQFPGSSASNPTIPNYPQPSELPQPGINSGSEPSTPSPQSPFHGTTVTDGVIHVPGNPDIPIRDKFPGMTDGLPAGISETDISDLLYKFHYTVGFHGHYEMGLKNGAKVGGYFVNGRDGVSRVVTYVADENGFRPKVKFVRLDLSSDEVPKEGTEKTFGLKSFEFVWYPIK